MKLIRKARKVCKITQTSLAQILDMDQGNYCNIENGKMIISSIPVIKIKIIEYILPKLDNVIDVKSKELADIKKLRQDLVNDFYNTKIKEDEK